MPVLSAVSAAVIVTVPLSLKSTRLMLRPIVMSLVSLPSFVEMKPEAAISLRCPGAMM